MGLVLRFWFLLVVVVAGTFFGAGTASAHASLVSTAPATGTHVDEAPSELVMQLNEPVSLIEGSAQLIDGDGGVADLADVRLDDGQRRIVLVPAETIPDGAYLATARVVSADTHVVSLSIQFTVGSVTQQGEFDPGASATGAEQYLNYPSKTLTYVGLVLSSGLFLATVWVWRSATASSRFRAVYRIGGGLLVVGVLGRLLVLVAQQSGGLSAITWSSARMVLWSPHGVAAVAAVVLSLVVIIVPPRGVRSGIGLAQVVASILAVTLGGHGGSEAGWPLAFLGTGLHVYGITVWLGGLALLLLVVRGTDGIRRWHVVAAGHVALVVVAGVLLSLLQISPLPALWGTAYGLVLLGKVFGVAIVVGLGYLTYRNFGRKTLAVETAVAVLVLALTSVLSTLAPAKDVYTTNIATSLDFGSAEVLNIGIDSVRRGPQELTLEYQEGGDLPTVSVDFSSAAANVARLPVQLSEPELTDGSVLWHSERLTVPAPGEWKVTIRFDGAHGPKVASFFYDAL